jgi:ribosomal protein L29
MKAAELRDNTIEELEKKEQDMRRELLTSDFNRRRRDRESHEDSRDKKRHRQGIDRCNGKEEQIEKWQ